MMLYRNMKVKVRFLDGNTDYFDIVAGVLQRDTLALYLFIVCLDFGLRTSIDKMKDNDFKPTKERSRRYSTQTFTDADYAEDIALLANKPAQAETLQHRLEQAPINAHKTEYNINGYSLKLVDKFTYLGSGVWSTKTDINTRLAKAWTANSRISVIWKSDPTNKIKRSFFQEPVVSIMLYGCTT